NPKPAGKYPIYAYPVCDGRHFGRRHPSGRLSSRHHFSAFLATPSDPEIDILYPQGFAMSSISRRTFFQGAALAASATQVIGANDRIRVGIVGIGGRGTAHLQYYLKIPGAQVAGLCDVNQAARERAQATVAKANAPKAGEFDDLRKMFAQKDIDAVSIATPNHWHALSAIWAAEAGKDVYVEKPASHNIYEGGRMIETARKTKRMLQVGSQSRSIPHKRKAIQLLHEGVIGDVYEARALCFKRRKSIGVTPPEPVPAGIDWDIFLGPAPMRPFTKNRYKYNWHW